MVSTPKMTHLIAAIDPSPLNSSPIKIHKYSTKFIPKSSISAPAVTDLSCTAYLSLRILCYLRSTMMGVQVLL